MRTMRFNLLISVLLVVNGCKDKSAEIYVQAESLFAQEQYDQAVPLLVTASEKGNADAQLLLGKCYEEGKGVEVDEVRSTQLYRSAADQDHPKAIYKLAESYVSGRGIGKSQDTAEALIAKCAELKDLKCMARLIMIKRGATSTDEDIAESLQLAEEVALTNYSALTEEGEKTIVLKARINYSRIFLMGKGTAVDSVESLKWALIYNEDKTGMSTNSQTNMFGNIRMTYDHLSKQKVEEAKTRAEQALGHPLKNYDNLFILEEPEFD